MAKLLSILTALDRSSSTAGMDIPGFRLHPLKGRMRGHYAVSVSANSRVTFRFDDGHAVDVNYLGSKYIDNSVSKALSGERPP